jgi:hypothetical protein
MLGGSFPRAAPGGVTPMPKTQLVRQPTPRRRSLYASRWTVSAQLLRRLRAVGSCYRRYCLAARRPVAVAVTVAVLHDLCVTHLPAYGRGGAENGIFF